MTPYDIDSTLHDAALPSTSLDDGFSPPTEDAQANEPAPQQMLEAALAAKSNF